MVPVHHASKFLWSHWSGVPLTQKLIIIIMRASASDHRAASYGGQIIVVGVAEITDSISFYAETENHNSSLYTKVVERPFGCEQLLNFVFSKALEYLFDTGQTRTSF